MYPLSFRRCIFSLAILSGHDISGRSSPIHERQTYIFFEICVSHANAIILELILHPPRIIHGFLSHQPIRHGSDTPSTCSIIQIQLYIRKAQGEEDQKASSDHPHEKYEERLLSRQATCLGGALPRICPHFVRILLPVVLAHDGGGVSLAAVVPLAPTRPSTPPGHVALGPGEHADRGVGRSESDSALQGGESGTVPPFCCTVAFLRSGCSPSRFWGPAFFDRNLFVYKKK